MCPLCAGRGKVGLVRIMGDGSIGPYFWACNRCGGELFVPRGGEPGPTAEGLD